MSRTQCYVVSERDDKLHPIAYGSRGLNMSERNYSAHKLELVALKWVLTDKFSYYLYNSHH